MPASAAPAPGAPHATGATRPGLPPRLRIAAVITLVPLLVTLALWAFAWPAARTAPRDLPLGVAGPAAASVQQELERREGAFEIHRYADEAAARAAIEDRDVYGAVITTAEGPRVLTASAASPLVAQMLQQAVTEQLSAGSSAQVEAVDVVPAPAADPRGAALSSSVLPLVLAGTAAGGMVTVLGLRGLRAAGALIGAAAMVGLAAASIAHSWLGVLTGNWWVEAGVFGLTTLAVSGAVAGLAALMGPAGTGLGAVVVVLLGNPFSGAASAPEMLPAPAGVIGQSLPPGAGVSLLRSVSFFDGAAATGSALTLTWWATLGLGAVLLGNGLRNGRTAPAPRTERELTPSTVS